MRYSPGQTRVLRGRPVKDDQRRVTVLNLVAKHNSPPLLKNITLQSIGGSRGKAEMAGGNGSPHFCRISPSFSGEETLTTPGFCVTDSVISSGQFGHFLDIAPTVPCPRQALQTRQTRIVGYEYTVSMAILLWLLLGNLSFHFYYKNDSFICSFIHSERLSNRLV